MPEEIRPLARTIVERIKPFPAADLFRIRPKVRAAFISQYVHKDSQPIVELPRELAHDPKVIDTFREILLQDANTTVSMVKRFEYNIQTSTRYVYTDSISLLKIYESAFFLWRDVEQKSSPSRLIVGDIEVPLAIHSPNPDLGELDQQTPLLRYCGIEAYRETIDELVLRRTTRAVAILRRHRHKVATLNDIELNTFLDAAVNQCNDLRRQKVVELTEAYAASSLLVKESISYQLKEYQLTRNIN